MAKLRQRSLFRVIYRSKGEFWAGRRKTIVADELQQAIDRVLEYEESKCPGVEIEITEVAREAIEVWS